MPVLVRCDACGAVTEPGLKQIPGCREARHAMIPRRWFVLDVKNSQKLACGEECRKKLMGRHAPKEKGSGWQVPEFYDLKAFGAKLRLFRTLRGYSQDDIAIRIGTSQSHVSKAERGELALSARALAALPQLLRVRPGSLFA